MSCAASSATRSRVGSLAVVVMAFLAVVREGLETALIFFAAAQGADHDAGPLLALLARRRHRRRRSAS